MADPVERLVLRRFRGATTTTELRFDAGRPLAIIYGANGSGKSTIIDAIDLVCNRQPGSVRDRSSTSARQHLPAIGHRAADLSVELTCGGSTWRGSYAGRIAVDGPGAPPLAHVLRRHHLLQLVEAAPGERYEALARFIDVRGVEQSEQALRDAHKRATRALEDETARVEQARLALDDLWAADGRPGYAGSTPLDWAAGKAAADAGQLQAQAAALERVLQCLRDAVRAGDEASAAAAQATRAADAADRLAEQAAERSGAEGEGGVRLVALLKAAAVHLAAPDPGGACPLCRQPVDAGGLRAEVAARLADMAALVELQAEGERAVRARDQTAALLTRSRAALVSAAANLADALRSGPAEAIAGFHLAWERYASLLSAGADDLDWAVCEAGDLVAAVSALEPALTARLEGLRADLSRHHAVRQSYERVVGGSERVAAQQAFCERLAAAVEVVRVQRIAFTQRVLDGVAQECNRLYARIHEGEALGGIRLFLDEGRRGSLLQNGTFEGHAGVPPQAYFSEAHLDTLGFCLFLALARAAGGDGAILALDDVFASTDQEHRARVLAVLVEESAHFRHVVFTTHHPGWLTLLRQDEAAARRVQWIPLHPWSLAGGIRAAA